MPEPGLSEILNFTADPMRGTGTPAVVFDSNSLIKNLNEAAQYKSENDWRKYNMFMGNLKEVYKDLNEIAKQPILTEDRDKIKNSMATLLKKISSDPHGFFGGGAKYQETLGEIAKLQTDVTESKQNSLYDAAHRQYFYANPELDTEENRSVLDGYRKQALGARQPYLLKLPGIFDPKAIADSLVAATKRDFKEDAYTPDGKNIKTVEGTMYDPKAWEKQKKDFFMQVDKRGNPFGETIRKRWEGSPELKKMYATPYDYFSASIDAYKPQDEIKTSLKESQIYINERDIAAALKRARISESGANYRANLPYEKMKEAERQKLLSAKDGPLSGDVWNKVIKEQFEGAKSSWLGKFIPKNYTGSVNLPASDFTGLSIGLFGEKTQDGKDFGMLVGSEEDGKEPLDVKFSFKNGDIVGYSVGGIYINKDIFNQKATMMRNYNMSNPQTDADPNAGLYQQQKGAAITDPNILAALEAMNK